MLNTGLFIIEVIQILDEILITMENYHDKKAPMLPRLKMNQDDVKENVLKVD